jgi:NADH-quinone oxidoreductase subunit G
VTEAPPKEDLVPLTIDGIQIEVPKGTLIIRAAEQLGIAIPRFCDHPLLDPAGACRQCLVEVTDMGNGRGMPKPAASCTTTVMPGMVVKTQLSSKIADKAQQGVMELLLINHPLDCPICDKGGECPLQNQAMSNGRGDSRFNELKRTFAKPVAISSNVLLDRERCISCQRCTRFSLQIAGDPFIEFLERGPRQQIGTSEEVPFQSYFSGNTVQICPVGALTGASYRFRARPFDLRSTDSMCEHCSSGCAQRTDWRRSKVMRRMSGNDPQVNEEWNCDKGRWAFNYATQSDRLISPLARNAAGELVPVSWPDAMERAAQGLAEAADRGGVGVLPGGRLTEEDAYAYAKFARVALRTNDVDARVRPLSAEESDFLAAFVAGVGPEHVSYADLESAPAVLFVGFEPEEESPIVFLRLRKSTRKGATKVWSIAAVGSRGLTKLAGTLIPCRPGAEGEALGALSDEVAGALGADGALILVGERLASSPGARSAAGALAARTGARLAWVPRRAGERGAVDAGALPTLLPGGRLVTDADARAAVEAVWGAPIPHAPGRDADAIWHAAAEGSLAALLVGAVDPDDAADPALARQALERAGFIVSLEIRHSAVTEHADVVLPVAPVVEKSGRFVNWEGRRRPFELTFNASNAAGGSGAVSDARLLDALAEEMDIELDLRTVEAERAELIKLPPVTSRAQPPSVAASSPAQPGPGEALLATWHELIDAGRMQDGDEYYLGTAKPVRALLSAATAAEVGVDNGEQIAVATDRGVITAPVEIAAMPDRVVWLPTNARGCAVRAALGAQPGAVVKLTRPAAPPVIGTAGGQAEGGDA